MISNRMKTLVKGVAALGVLISTMQMLSCMKAGDGVGLDSAASVSHCVTAPTSFGCPGFDSCTLTEAEGKPVRCPGFDSCTLPVGKKPPRCTVHVDPCIANPTAQGCTVAVDSCDGLHLPNGAKPVSCLDKDYFTKNVLPIFVANCKICHNSADRGTAGYAQTKLSLIPEDAWDSTVNVKSFEVGMAPSKVNMMRVSPGRPDSSYLYWKITMDQPKLGIKTRMPLNTPFVPLSDADILTIRTWILGKN